MHDDPRPVVELPVVDPRGDEDIVQKRYDQSPQVVDHRMGHSNVVLELSHKQGIHQILAKQNLQIQRSRPAH